MSETDIKVDSSTKINQPNSSGESPQTINNTKDDFLEKVKSILNVNDNTDSSSSEDESKTDDYGNFENEPDMQLVIEMLQRGNESNSKRNKTFTEDRLREIDRKNSILMKKIISNNRRPSQYNLSSTENKHTTSAAINRKRQQRKIDHENLVSVFFLPKFFRTI